jgi:hypothetical protein
VNQKYLMDCDTHSPKDVRSFSVLLIGCTALRRGAKKVGIKV